MPEEKKDNKAAAKDSFTFSDKIKNSKPAASKSFANRISSKIGSDGKPRRTLFERTKRDAPFFIAAIVALLLLPFLYKYSGSVDEDPSMVTPATEETAFDPNRSGFDGIGDPEGQIAQLSGRDSMDLIVGFGNKKEEPEDLSFNSNFERSGFDSEDYGNTNNNTKEYNEKNIYRYKKQAAPATKASFQKTNINPLRGAGLTSRGGGKLGVGMWGGGLKQAANRVKADGPRTSPKPVSLQPLQAAGKPSRSYFGQGAAAEARRSKDAMSKGNAMQALMDAQMKPIEPGKIGGIGGGDFGGPGGGNGDLKREFNFTGKEPWWWDMMKKRSQMEWEKKFNRKWGWIDFADKLAQNILGGILNCLITGQDDGSMGSMFGEGAGQGKVPTCCGKKASKIGALLKQETGLDFSKEACDNHISKVGKEACPGGWDDGNPSDSNLGFLGARIHCLGIVGGGAAKYAAGAPAMAEDGADGSSSCGQLASANVYYTRPQGEAMKWKKYHYVVARNYVPLDNNKKLYLCANNSHTLDFTCKYSSGVSSFNAEGRAADAQKLARYVAEWNEKDAAGGFAKRPSLLAAFKQLNPSCNLTAQSTSADVRTFLSKNLRSGAVSKKNDYSTFVDLNQERAENACVIYVGESDTFEYQKFQAAMIDRLQELMREQGMTAKPEDAFADLDLFFIESMFSKYDMYDSRLWYGNKGMSRALPMKYEDFEQAYLYRRGSTSDAQKEGNSRRDVCKRKYRILDERDGKVDTVIGHRCMFSNVNIKCTDNSQPAEATVSVSKSFKGKTSDLQVRASYMSFEKDDKGAAKNTTANPQGSIVNPDASGKYLFKLGAEAPAGTVRWNLYRSGYLISTATCDVNDGATAFGVPENECPAGMNTNEECCAKLGGANYQWDGGKCVHRPDEDPAPSADKVRLAPVIEWIPSDMSARVPVPAGQEPSAGSFTGGKAVPASTKGDVQNCGAEMSRIAIESADAKAFTNQVVAAYNRTHADKPMAEVDASYPTMGEFVDSLFMASNMGIADVPNHAVCMLGQAMAQQSRDPDAGHLTWGAAGNAFHNELGSYLAYVHADAAFYPAKYYQDAGNCDKRFLAVGESGCPNNILVASIKGKKQYHHSNYAWNGQKGAYLNSLTPTMKENPLRALAAGTSFSAGQCKKGCGPARNKYNQTFKHLLIGQCPTGNMKVADALKYVKGVCDSGLNYKPYGTPGSSTGIQTDDSGPSQNISVRGRK